MFLAPSLLRRARETQERHRDFIRKQPHAGAEGRAASEPLPFVANEPSIGRTSRRTKGEVNQRGGPRQSVVCEWPAGEGCGDRLRGQLVRVTALFALLPIARVVLAAGGSGWRSIDGLCPQALGIIHRKCAGQPSYDSRQDGAKRSSASDAYTHLRLQVATTLLHHASSAVRTGRSSRCCSMEQRMCRET